MSQPKIKATQIQGITQGGGAPSAADIVPTQAYVDAYDKSSAAPKAGFNVDDSVVPVYANFPFSLGSWGSSTFEIVDGDGRFVVYYHSTTPLGNIQCYRSYRYSETAEFVYDAEAVSVPFLNSGEQVRLMLNVSTNHAFLQLVDTTASHNQTRLVIVNTHGSSAWRDWTLAWDVTTLSTFTLYNWQVANTTSGFFPMSVGWDTSSGIQTLTVYNSSLVQQRTLTLIDCVNEVDPIDHSGAGTIVSGQIKGPGYTAWAEGSAFTWNPQTQTFYQRNQGYYTRQAPGGPVLETGWGMTIAWHMPDTWISSGVGTPTNLTTIKSGAYRYRQIPDATWDTNGGGMAGGYGANGQAASMTTDEYSGQLILASQGTFTAGGGAGIYRWAAGTEYTNIGSNMPAPISSFGTIIPDGSAWSKYIYVSTAQVIDNSIMFVGDSQKFGGGRYISAPFSPTVFLSIASANDTLKLDPLVAQVGVDATAGLPSYVAANFSPLYFGTASNAGTPVAYFARPGSPINTITVSGATRTYTATSVTPPALTGTVGGVTVGSIRTTVWNGSTSSPIVWSSFTASDGRFYVAKWSGTTWSIPGGPLAQTQIDSGKSARGDGQNLVYIENSSVYTAGGFFPITFTIPFIGGSNNYFLKYNTANDTATVEAFSTHFTAAGTGGVGQYQGGGDSNRPLRSFGFSSSLGYYVMQTSQTGDNASIISSRNIQTGTSTTEANWFAGTSQTVKFITTQGAVGLFAYVVPYPITLGGYATTLPNATVTLVANSVNYIYATKTTTDRTTVTISSSTQLLPSSYSRMVLASMTTDSDKVISQTAYSYDGTGLPSAVGHSDAILTTDGLHTTWQPQTSFRGLTANGAVVLGDRNGGILSNTNSVQLSLPQDVTMPAGFSTTFFVGGGVTGNTIVPASGVTMYYMGSGVGAARTTLNIAAGGFATVMYTAPTTWFVYGQGLS